MITFVHSSSGDWVGLYVDGVLQTEGHILNAKEVLNALGIGYETIHAEHDRIEDLGNCPHNLEDL